MLSYKLLNHHGRGQKWQYTVQALYSRRSSSKQADSYTIVGNRAETSDDYETAPLGVNPNWELLTPRGFRFYLPGSVGPAWHDASTTANVASNVPIQASVELEYVAQDCPVLLRQGVNELFPGADLNTSPLTVVTLSQKTSKPKRTEVDSENCTKLFVLAAKDVCSRLKLAGYWADFINPFSGLPYLNTYYHNAAKLYQTDQRFRCLGFRIVEQANCRIIADKMSRRFVGSLFTNAPPNTSILQDVIQGYDENQE